MAGMRPEVEDREPREPVGDGREHRIVCRGDEGHARIGVPDLVGDLVGCEPGVHRREDAADLRQAEPGDEELGAVVDHEHDPVALDDAEVRPGRCRAVDRLADRRVRHRLVLPDKERLIGDIADRGVQEVAHVEPTGIDAHAAPNSTVAWADRTPPTPWTRATCASGT